MSKAFLNRQKAKMYVAMVYRNQTILEDYHASGIPLNEEFYERMRVIVAKAIIDNAVIINKAIEVHGKNHENLAGLCNEEILVPLLSAKMIDEWDKPIKVSDRLAEGQDIAEFILSGEFKRKCLLGAVLSDTVMCEVNHDVFNRIFTLVCRNVI